MLRQRRLFRFLICLLSTMTVAADGPNVAPADDQKPAAPEWIWSDGDPEEEDRVYFRTTFELPAGEVKSAKLYATGDNEVRVYVNGERVLEHYSWETVIRENVTEFLREGSNFLAARGKNSGGPAGVLIQLEIEWADGRTQSIVSNAEWRATADRDDGWRDEGFDDSEWEQAKSIAPLGGEPWKSVTSETIANAIKLREPAATPVELIKVAKGFDVELLYSVPADEQGSWVNMCVDPQGRLIVSDQYGGLFRVTVPGPDEEDGELNVEPLDLDIGEAQGLLWAFDSLYIVVNHGGNYASGLYRAQDTDGDGELDEVTQLRELNGGGEHGPHAVLLSPDGESLTIVCGNNTRLPEIDSSRVPQVWDEDMLLPRLYGRGFMKGVPAPGGFIARTDPEGKTWELIATGFRNQFDAAYNHDGELFAYDADMEWDMNCPWYRPTRVCHVVSGAEFGWRNGSGKFPVDYPDSLPATLNIGPGSPTGVCFGYGADFPEQYQNALFLCDWSYGKLFAAHLVPDGSTYTGTFEEFVTGTPLPLTDVVVNPQDGAMYFTIGGRKVQSGLYRVTYSGGEAEQVEGLPEADPDAGELRAVRSELEALHQETAGAVEKAWPYLNHADRFIRTAARIAIEHQPVEEWRDRALSETDPQSALTALLALARQQERPDSLRNDVHDPVLIDYENRPDLEGVDLELKAELLAALGRLEWGSLSHQQRIHLLRVYTIVFARMGPPDAETREELIERFDKVFPADGPLLNSELCRLMVYLQAPSAAEKAIALLEAAPTQEEQIDYAMSLRFLREGWTDELRRAYYSWFPKALGYRGGANFTMFIGELKETAVELLTEEQKTALKEVLEQAPEGIAPAPIGPPRELVQKWTLDELLPLVADGLHDRDFERGREMFGAAKCFACHRFANEGGAIGPDLTSLAGRFSQRDILESIVNPNKTISDQYSAVQILTIDGNVVVGRIVNLSGDNISVNTNMLDPNAQVNVDVKQIEEMQPSKVSMMPEGLLDTLHEEEILDLMAYLLSRGDPESDMFAEAGGDGEDGGEQGVVDPPEGFRALFNGEDLSGWHGMPHFDPRELAALSDEERQAKIDEWTAEAKEHWTVENGELVNDGHGAYLTTDEEFGDYELLIDYKTVPQADSGIYLKANPQVQIWDYTEEGGKWEIGADKGSGGLWNNSPGAPGKDPMVLADKPFGEWNSFRILQVGARTSVWLNDELVVDHALMENFWDRAAPLFRKGPIQLQTHGGEIRWRNIFLREIGPEEANRILWENSGEDFEPIFNGKDLTGWTGAVENYEVVDGAIRCKEGHGGTLFTEEVYDDFQVRLQFKLPPGGNNGLAIRFPGEGNPAYAGMCELQVLDTEHEKYLGRLDPRQGHGSAYGMAAAHRGFLRPTGEWNVQMVTVRGSTIRVELNGSVILDVDLDEVTEFMADSPHPGKDLTEGHFGFAGHSDPVEFRKIEIKRLEPAAEQAAAWPQFHGPDSSGRPLVDDRLPEQIDPATNVVWKIELPPGHSSPVVAGDRLFVTAVREGELVTICLDRMTGETLWEDVSPHESLEDIHRIGSHAQSSPATDGTCVVSFFGSSGLNCYELDGRLRWRLPMGPFNNGFGAANSPVISGDRVILCQDHDTDSFLAAYDLKTGSTLWETDRSEFPRNYCSPVIWDAGGKKQIVVAATLRVVGYDFASGDELWTVRGLSRTVCTTPVIGEDGRLYVAGWANGGDAGARISLTPFDEKIVDVDANGNGEIERSELAEEEGSDLERRYELIDRDKSGGITQAEYENYRNIFDQAQNAILTIAPGGEGDITDTHVAWRYEKHVPFCASLVVSEGTVFGIKDGGILTTVDAGSGDAVKTGRLAGNGNYYASPVIGDGKLFAVDQNGELSIVRAAAEWELVSSANFGEAVYATPAIVEGRLYLRTDGHLYCFGS